MKGFRALAERSSLADRVKDAGAVSRFPQLASSWDEQVNAPAGWDNFSLADFQRLARAYPVTWIVTRRPLAELDCPYRAAQVSVCKLTSNR